METMQFFAGRGRNGEVVRLPKAYRQSAKWVPHIGDIFPDFDATTTHGPIRFHDWAEGHWTVLFSQPGAFTPVCTTELASLASAQHAFDARKARLIGLTRDTSEDQKAWCDEVGRLFDAPIRFPMIEDCNGTLAGIFGMRHPKENPTIAIRKTLILDPALRIRMIFEYPTRIGRSTEEVLRILDALQHQDALDVATPADWQPGDRYLVPSDFSAQDADAHFGQNWHSVAEYLRVIEPDGLVRTARARARALAPQRGPDIA